MMKLTNKIPFDFILDYLPPKKVRINPMFGCFAIYFGLKLVFIVRDRKDKTELNGVWLASSYDNIGIIAEILPGVDLEARLVERKSKGSSWLLIPKTSSEFEEAVILACEMVSAEDPRIGKITKSSALIQ